MKVLAFAVSILFHPLLLPLYVLFITFNTGTVFTYIPAYTQNMSYLLTLLGVTLIPLLCLPLLKWLGLIEGYRLVQKQDRVFPVLVTIVGAFIVFYFSRNLPYSNIVRQFYLIMVIMLSGFMIVMIRWKISMHMTAIGALCGFVFILGMKYLGDVINLLPLLILVSGLVASARLYLKQHTPAQVYVGYIYGRGGYHVLIKHDPYIALSQLGGE